VLYPGETGAIAFLAYGYGQKPEGYYRKSERSPSLPPQLGLFYRYETNYILDPDLEKIFHPEAENVTFKVTNHHLEFEFDMEVPFAEPLDLIKQRINFPAWVKVYDAQGRLMDVINKNLDLVDFLELNSRNHVYGFTKLNGDPNFRDYQDRDHLWLNYIDIQPEDEALISRIEVLVEFRWEASLRQSPCWEAYRKR
jgi:hypothetical protein